MVDQNTIKIEVPKNSRARSVVPGHVFRQQPFKWDVPAFPVEHEKFEGKLVTERPQIESFKTFIGDPSFKGIYSVAGSPDDVQAKYFAAYLTHVHMQAFPQACVVWHPLYGGFSNQLLENPISGVSLLVLYNLTPSSTPVKLEKARDLLEYYNDAARIVISAGTDPVTFMCGKLFMPINGIAMHLGKALNVEVL